MKIFIDILGTLISGGTPRLLARSVFVELAEMGHDVYLWSGAGTGYAASAANTLEPCLRLLTRSLRRYPWPSIT